MKLFGVFYVLHKDFYFLYLFSFRNVQKAGAKPIVQRFCARFFAFISNKNQYLSLLFPPRYATILLLLDYFERNI